MDIRKIILIGAVILLAACSSQQNGSDFDESLYSGKPVESLTSDAPPATEVNWALACFPQCST